MNKVIKLQVLSATFAGPARNVIQASITATRVITTYAKCANKKEKIKKNHLTCNYLDSILVQ